MKFILTLVLLCGLAVVSSGQIVFEDHFDNCSIHEDWSILRDEWTATSNGLLLGIGEKPWIGSGSLEFHDYILSCRWLANYGQDLVVTINSKWDPSNGDWSPGDPVHAVVLWIQATGTISILDSTLTEPLEEYASPISTTYGPWGEKWMSISFGIEGNEIVGRMVFEGRGEIGYVAAPLRDVTSTGGFWSIETQNRYLAAIDDVVVSGEGPVNSASATMGDVKNLFR